MAMPTLRCESSEPGSAILKSLRPMNRWMKFPERRQSLRVVTLKNAAWVAVALFAFFLVYSTYNELRSVDPSRERLYERGRVTTTTTTAKPAEVVGETPAPSVTYDVP